MAKKEETPAVQPQGKARSAKASKQQKVTRRKEPGSGKGAQALVTGILAFVLVIGLGMGGYFGAQWWLNRDSGKTGSKDDDLVTPVAGTTDVQPQPIDNPVMDQALAAGVAGTQVGGVLASGGEMPAEVPTEQLTQNGTSTPKPPPKPFEFSNETFRLPPDSSVQKDDLESRVRRDVTSYLESLDNRPGTQMVSVVIDAQTTSPEGFDRLLVYVFGGRYAVAGTTLFDYGTVAGPMALDYNADGRLMNMTLPMSGDNFEPSIEAFCMDRPDVAQRMIDASYELSLRAKMVKQLTAYIGENNLNVDYFRLGSQVYYADGTLRAVSAEREAGGMVQQSAAAPAGDAPQANDGTAPADLLEDYKFYQNLPH